MFSSRDKHSDSDDDDKKSGFSDDKKSGSSDDEKRDSSDENSYSSDDGTKDINPKKRDEQSEVSSTSNKMFASHDKHTGYTDDKQSDSSDDKISDSDERSDDSSDDDTEHISLEKRDEQCEVSSTGKKIFASHDKLSGYSDDKHCGYSDDKQTSSSDDKKSDSSDDDVKRISLENLDDYLEQVGLLGDNQQITKRDTSAAFEKFAKGKDTVILEQFNEILKDIADSKNLNLEEMKIKLKSVFPDIMESSVCGASSGSKSKEPSAN